MPTELIGSVKCEDADGMPAAYLVSADAWSPPAGSSPSCRRAASGLNPVATVRSCSCPG